MVTQYDVELFQKIEALTGHKMEEYPSEQEAVLLLLERVGEAQRISTMQVHHPICLHLITAVFTLCKLLSQSLLFNMSCSRQEGSQEQC